GSAPNNCTPTGRSSAGKFSISLVCWLRCNMPSAETNSVTNTSAPCSLQSRRKIESVTPAIGARQRGCVLLNQESIGELAFYQHLVSGQTWAECTTPDVASERSSLCRSIL